jgi:hypothetical protein
MISFLLVSSLINLTASVTTVLYARKAQTARTEAQTARTEAQTANANTNLHEQNIVQSLEFHLREVKELEREILIAKSSTFSYSEMAKLYADTSQKHKEATEQHASAIKELHEDIVSTALEVSLLHGSVSERAEAVAAHTAEVKNTAKIHQIIVKAISRCSKCGFRVAKYSVSGDGVVTCASCDNDAYQRSLGV